MTPHPKWANASIQRRLHWKARDAFLAKPARHRPKGKTPVVAGFFRTASGVGEGARAQVAAMKQQAREPTCVDVSEMFDQIDQDAAWELSALPEDRDGLLYLHANAPETERALFELGMFRPKRWYTVGVWAWELSKAPTTWRRPSKLLSQINVPSSFVAESLQGIVTAPVNVVPHAVEVDTNDWSEARSIYRASIGLTESNVVCLAMADGRSSLYRKNLLGAIDAFERSRSEQRDAHLVIKTRNLDTNHQIGKQIIDRAQTSDQIHLINENLSTYERNTLLAASDIFLSPHRSEGFGLALAEAMAHGKPVIATGWSGNTDFMTSETSVLIGSVLTSVDDPTGIYTGTNSPSGAQWAEPDMHAFSDALTGLLGKADRRHTIGSRAKTHIGQVLSPASIQY
ncbi:MAG: glycosyltransferase family 4 protein [Pseudomonadota bacterium]